MSYTSLITFQVAPDLDGLLHTLLDAQPGQLFQAFEEPTRAGAGA